MGDLPDLQAAKAGAHDAGKRFQKSCSALQKLQTGRNRKYFPYA